MKSGNRFFDILIIGAGPAGLAAAIAAGQEGAVSIGIIEKKEVPGKKLSATGNGRCNVSNAKCFDEEVREFFDSIGLVVKTDGEGRVYPYSEEAGQVTGLLVDTAKKFNTEIITDCQVSWVKADGESASAKNGGFVVGAEITGKSKNKKEEIVIGCKKLLIAVGGKSYAVFGSTGDGFGWARQLGHQVSRLAPSLVPVEVEEQVGKLAGLRLKGKVTLLHRGKSIYEEKGEIQFNKDSISGICIMNISKLLHLAEGMPFRKAFNEYEIEVDMVPDFTEEEIRDILKKKSDQGTGVLVSLVRKKMSDYIIEGLGDKAGRDEIAKALKSMRFKVKGTKGWNEAQVTRGGVSIQEVNELTMESKIVKGLYFAGEVLDYDGFCGGYNLDFAWRSGTRAGRDMAKNV